MLPGYHRSCNCMMGRRYHAGRAFDVVGCDWRGGGERRMAVFTSHFEQELADGRCVVCYIKFGEIVGKGPLCSHVVDVSNV